MRYLLPVYEIYRQDKMDNSIKGLFEPIIFIHRHFVAARKMACMLLDDGGPQDCSKKTSLVVTGSAISAPDKRQMNVSGCTMPLVSGCRSIPKSNRSEEVAEMKIRGALLELAMARDLVPYVSTHQSFRPLSARSCP